MLFCKAYARTKTYSFFNPCNSIPPNGPEEKGISTLMKLEIVMEITLIGNQGMSVIVKDNKIRIHKKGGIFSSARTKTLLPRNITSVEVKKPGTFFVGFIQFSIAGSVPRDSKLTLSGGAMGAASDENSVLFKSDNNYKIALLIKNWVENYSEVSVSSGSSDADELRKMKALLDEGIISLDEFNHKKKSILGL